MRDANVDTIVLGCTHYPLVSKTIEAVMQKKLHLIETGAAITKHLLTLSKEKGHQNEGGLDIYLYHTGSIKKDIIATLVENVKTITQLKL